MFKVKEPDYDMSPYTGLTRESWLEAGKYLLEGIFRHIESMEHPVVVPRTETEITYPHLKASAETQKVQRAAEVFEGLTRSFFIAAPLLQNIPDLEICGFPMAEYYKKQVLYACTKGHPLYVGTYAEQQEITGYENPFRTFQQTVETCALVICLWISKEQIWDTYTKEERDIIAALLESYAHENTVPQNWRLFNMLNMAFLNNAGYPIQRDVMRDHAQAILNYYAGDGWYRDGHSFDYYSCWAFNMYAPIWNVWYGYENEPYLAKRFEENSNRLMETYGDFFDRDGWTNMWGRSGIYRNAATAAFDGNMLLRESKGNPGRARRIASGSLMQFLGREDFLQNGIPTLGFYGQFSPLVQAYSCAESPFWLGKAFLCLHLPENHPFWTEKENNGTWEELAPKQVKVTTLDGPALCFSNHEANSETVLRTGKVNKCPGDMNGIWNYGKLNYNSKFPWEATPVQRRSEKKSGQENDSMNNDSWNQVAEAEARETDVAVGIGKTDAIVMGEEIEPVAVESQQYVIKDGTTGGELKGNLILWYGERDNVLYRRQFFDYKQNIQMHWTQAINLADFPVPYGILRVDKLRLHRCPVSITLGSYGFPDNGTEIEEKTNGKAKAIILKGTDALGNEKQMAMTIYDGWKDLKLIYSIGTNPDSEKSIVIYAETKREKQYGYVPYILISQVITKESHIPFTEEELYPIESVTYTDPEGCGGYGPVTVRLKDGTVRTVEFEGMEGKLML